MVGSQAMRLGGRPAGAGAHAIPMMREPLTPMYRRMHMRKPPAMPSHMVGDRICKQEQAEGRVVGDICSRQPTRLHMPSGCTGVNSSGIMHTAHKCTQIPRYPAHIFANTAIHGCRDWQGLHAGGRQVLRGQAVVKSIQVVALVGRAAAQGDERG